MYLKKSAMKKDGSIISDHQVRNYLIKKGFKKIKGEWLECKKDDVKSAILAIKENKVIETNRIFNFKLRPEQQQAIFKTKNYFKNFKNTRK